MLPKKRKFIPTEFETFSAQSSQEEEDNGMDLSIRPRPEVARRPSAATQDRNSVLYESPLAAAAAADIKSEFQSALEPDLTDWIGHRILARRDNFFSSGVISNVFDVTSVVVSFDTEDTPIVYHEVLRRENYGCIISDSVPSSKQVTILEMSGDSSYKILVFGAASPYFYSSDLIEDIGSGTFILSLAHGKAVTLYAEDILMYNTSSMASSWQ